MIFLGPLFNRKDEKIIKQQARNGLIQNQANTFQWNCIDGLIENGESIEIYNVLPVGTFPNSYGQIYLPTKKWIYKGKMNTEVGCINLPIIKQISRTIKCKKLLKKCDDKVIIIYSTYLPFLLSVRSLPADYKVVLVVTDLPEYYDNSSSKNRLVEMLRQINNKLLYKCFERVDGFVLLTEEMKYPLKVERRPYTIVEGICGKNLGPIMTQKDPGVKKILYTGTLNVKFGIANLVQAFLSIDDPSYRLQICGGGEYRKVIEELQKTDSRIEYYGFLSRNEVLNLQHNATVLINPRPNDDAYTKYSFPSKTMEYLQSGIPTIAYKLDGIPNEYDTYLNYIEGESIEDIKKAIIRVCGDDSGIFLDRAEKGRQFVESEKNYHNQAKKIIDLISRLN